MKSPRNRTRAAPAARPPARPASPGDPDGVRAPGFTLLELLVAMTILVMLGGALVTILRQGIITWHTAEKRGAIYDRARLVLDGMAEDLRCAAADSGASLPFQSSSSRAAVARSASPGTRAAARTGSRTSRQTSDTRSSCRRAHASTVQSLRSASRSLMRS